MAVPRRYTLPPYFARRGMTATEYYSHVLNGEDWCRTCLQWYQQCSMAGTQCLKCRRELDALRKAERKVS